MINPNQQPAMSIVNIDGDKIRALREGQDLTQLYLATVVGVTTDTISRWENRRYPTIKLENAEKLAAALNVALDELLDGGQKETVAPVLPDRDEDKGTSRQRSRRRLSWPQWGLAAALAVGLILALSLVLVRPPDRVTAIRILPAHAAANSPFPVLIQLQADGNQDTTVLIRDQLTGECETTTVGDDGSLKAFGSQPRWIGKLARGQACFLYLVQPKAIDGDQILFRGDLVLQGTNDKTVPIQGADRVKIAPFHWADDNQDLQISDGEILQAFERYSRSEASVLNLNQLEELWLSGTYAWDGHAFTTKSRDTIDRTEDSQ
jgi:transcriptional regulator with XRE-family HTH domain